MIPTAAALFLKNLPWKNIILGLLIGSVVLAIGLYIRNAEENRAEVNTLKTQKTELIQANKDLERSYKDQLDVLQKSFQNERERERDYAENIQIIESGPDGNCAINSPPIVHSLRLRHERRSRNTPR